MAVSRYGVEPRPPVLQAELWNPEPAGLLRPMSHRCFRKEPGNKPPTPKSSTRPWAPVAGCHGGQLPSRHTVARQASGCQAPPPWTPWLPECLFWVGGGLSPWGLCASVTAGVDPRGPSNPEVGVQGDPAPNFAVTALFLPRHPCSRLGRTHIAIRQMGQVRLREGRKEGSGAALQCCVLPLGTGEDLVLRSSRCRGMQSSSVGSHRAQSRIPSPSRMLWPLHSLPLSPLPRHPVPSFPGLCASLLCFSHGSPYINQAVLSPLLPQGLCTDWAVS